MKRNLFSPSLRLIVPATPVATTFVQINKEKSNA